MARLALRLYLDFPGYRPLFSVGSFSFGGRRFFTTNELMVPQKKSPLPRYPGLTGLKTGTTNTLRRHLAASATQDERTLIGVVMNCPDKLTRDTEMTTLLNRGFSIS